MITNKKHLPKGFSLVEVLVGTALFLVVSVAVYSSFSALFQLASGAQSRTLAVQLANEQFEIIRNMPYAKVGLLTGIPQGILPQNQTLVRGGVSFNVGLTIRNINLSTSTVQASDKLVEVNVDCPACKNFQPVILTGQIAPANLQSAGLGGALSVQVFDGSGQPVENASVRIQSLATSSIDINDVTNNVGILNIIGVPPGVDMYKITVTKGGYTTDQTFAASVTNPNPIRPNVTVLNQQISPVSFSIDRLSSLHFSSVTPLCQAVGGFDFSLTGAKQIGLGIPKYVGNLLTNGSGSLNLNDVEWDTYTIVPLDSGFEIAGINPFSPFTLNPGNSQSVQFVVMPKSARSIMVSVIDGTTNLPISGASVNLSGGGYNVTAVTGQGYMSQTDWSSGDGQEMYINGAKYYSGYGIDTATSSGDALLIQNFGLYDTNATGTLVSSTFDTGTSSNFYTFSWNPATQNIFVGSGSVKFQFATSPSSSPATWNFTGPDGTANTFYSSPDSPISPINNGNQYARYAMYLTTGSATNTPTISDTSFSYTSGCIPPGQVIFQGISTGEYNLTVSKTGYTNYTAEIDIVNGWQEHTAPLNP